MSVRYILRLYFSLAFWFLFFVFFSFFVLIYWVSPQVFAGPLFTSLLPLGGPGIPALLGLGEVSHPPCRTKRLADSRILLPLIPFLVAVVTQERLHAF